MTDPTNPPNGGNDDSWADLLAEVLGRDDPVRVGYLAALNVLDMDLGRETEIARLRGLDRPPRVFGA